MEDKNIMLTTFDNPFNPFTEFEAWFKEDHRLGHNCCELIARLSAVSDVSSEELREQDTRNAIEFIAASEPFIYKKVTKADFK